MKENSECCWRKEKHFFPVLLNEVSIYWKEVFLTKYQTTNPWANVNTRQEDKIHPWYILNTCCISVLTYWFHFKGYFQSLLSWSFFFFFFLKYTTGLQSFPTDNWLPSCTPRRACKQKKRVTKTLTCSRVGTGLTPGSRQEAKSQNTKQNHSLFNSENSHQRKMARTICLKKGVLNRSSETSKLRSKTRGTQEERRHSNSWSRLSEKVTK